MRLNVFVKVFHESGCFPIGIVTDVAVEFVLNSWKNNSSGYIVSVAPLENVWNTVTGHLFCIFLDCLDQKG